MSNPTYGSVDDVAALVAHMTIDRTFTSDRSPTETDITRWLNERCAQLDSLIAAQGYDLPITNETALTVLGRYANNGAAGDAELSLLAGGSDEDDENTRESRFYAIFNEAAAWIASGALRALGVPLAPVPSDEVSSGLFFFGVARSARGNRW